MKQIRRSAALFALGAMVCLIGVVAFLHLLKTESNPDWRLAAALGAIILGALLMCIGGVTYSIQREKHDRYWKQRESRRERLRNKAYFQAETAENCPTVDRSENLEPWGVEDFDTHFRRPLRLRGYSPASRRGGPHR